MALAHREEGDEGREIGGEGGADVSVDEITGEADERRREVEEGEGVREGGWEGGRGGEVEGDEEEEGQGGEEVQDLWRGEGGREGGREGRGSV